MFGFGKRNKEQSLEQPTSARVFTSPLKAAVSEPKLDEARTTAPRLSPQRTAPQRPVAGDGPRVVSTVVAPAEAPPKAFQIYGDVRFLTAPVETTQALAQIIFHEVINKQVKLGPHLYSRIAVAMLASGTKSCVLFIERSKLTEDELRAVVAQVQAQGYSLPEHGAQGYYAESQIVMGLSQGHLDAKFLSNEREIARDPQKNQLFATFVGIVDWAYANKADDIDFAVDQNANKSQLCFKIGGRYIRPEKYLLPTDLVIQMLGIAWQKSRGGAASTFEIQTEQQAQITLDLPKTPIVPNGARVRLRWSGLPNDKGTVVTTRIQRLGESALITSLDDAGYLDWHQNIMRRVLNSEGGMNILSGVVGSGKSTTLARMIQMLPKNIKIISFEDPVELEIQHAYQKTITRNLLASGVDEAFLAATRALYRSALDVLYLGEIRDPETGLVARQVAESGHSVYTTVHAKSALGIIGRFASPAIGIPLDVLATPGILKLLVYQSLLPKTCKHCGKSPDEYAHHFKLKGNQLSGHKEYFDRLYRLYNIEPENYRLRDPHGCDVCGNPEIPELHGLDGRTVVAEMIEPDEQMLEFVLQGKTLDLQRYWRSTATSDFTSEDLSGKSAMECAVFKAARGIIDPREIEPRFESFESVEMKRTGAQRASLSRFPHSNLRTIA